MDGYQRVIFPEAASGAELAETDLVDLAKLESVPDVYIKANTIEDIVFTFEKASETDKIGDAQSLHESDVVIDSTNNASVEVASVGGSNTVRIRASGTSGNTSTVTLSTRIVQASNSTGNSYI